MCLLLFTNVSAPSDTFVIMNQAALNLCSVSFCSMDENFMKAEGTASLAEALKVNTTLQSVRYPKALAFLHISVSAH